MAIAATTCLQCTKKYVYDRSKGHTRTRCGSCSVNHRRFVLKERMLAYKGGKCLLCGYSKCPRALVFHHVDDSTKDFGVSGSHTRAWAAIRRELDKCVLLCSNCHAEVHSGSVELPPIAQR